MSKPKIIGICGSPHSNGNTAKLLKKVLEGCQRAGAKVEFVSLADKKILFCKACYKCLTKGKCVLDDDLNEIREKMTKANGLVIGSPTYNREITALLETFLDRLFYDIHRQTFLGKYAVCISTYLISSGCAQKTLRDLTMALGLLYNWNDKCQIVEIWERNRKRQQDHEKGFRHGIKTC